MAYLPRFENDIFISYSHVDDQDGWVGVFQKQLEMELSREELKIVERMFQALTDTDARNRRVRRPANLSEIVAITGASRDTILKIIERFRGGGRSFLTLTGDDDPLIDISHESLIRQWERMSEWVQTEAESREMYRRVADAARTYHKHGRNRGLLWGSTQLQLASNWIEEREPNPQWAERYDSDFWQAMGFLARSRTTESWRNHLFWSAVSMAFIALLGLTLYAWQQQRAAKRQEQKANQLYYVANMKLAKETFDKKNYARGNELLKAFMPSPENGLLPLARDFFWYHLWGATQESQTFHSHEGSVFSVAFSPDGKTLASGSVDKTVKLWDVASGQNLATLKGHEASVLSVAFSPDGKTMASAGGDREKKDFAIRLWFAATDEDVARQRNK